jgi:Ca2+-binding RTX toxin-like protein
MRKTMLMLASVALAMVVLGGVAWAANIQCPNRQVATGALYCEGTNDPDTMHGTAKTDWMLGKAGRDTIYGYRGTDSNVEGGEGPDKLYGGRGKDYLVASCSLMPACPEGASTDYLHGGSDDDSLKGGFEQGGVDRLYGEKGDDRLEVAQRGDFLYDPNPGIEVTKEIVDCGPGIDSVRFDKGVDVVKANCERKIPFRKR